MDVQPINVFMEVGGFVIDCLHRAMSSAADNQWGLQARYSKRDVLQFVAIIFYAGIKFSNAWKDIWFQPSGEDDAFMKDMMTSELFTEMLQKLRFPSDLKDVDAYYTKYRAHVLKDTVLKEESLQDLFKKYGNEPNVHQQIAPIIQSVQNMIFVMQCTFTELFLKYKDLLQNENLVLTLDESLARFFGICPFRTRNPSKPAKEGLNFRVLTSIEPIFVLNLDLYIGEARGENTEGGILNSLVERMVQPAIQSGLKFQLVTDNLYTSEVIAEHMMSHGCSFLGTLRDGRISKDFFTKADMVQQFSQVKKNEKQKARKNPQEQVPRATLFTLENLLVNIEHPDSVNKKTNLCEMNKNKKVMLLKCPPEPLDYVLEWHKTSRGKRETEQSRLLREYNLGYFGVDRFDQLLAKVKVRAPMPHWNHKAYVFLLQTLLYNSFILYQKKSQTQPTFKDFTMSVIKALKARSCEQSLETSDEEENVLTSYSPRPCKKKGERKTVAPRPNLVLPKRSRCYILPPQKLEKGQKRPCGQCHVCKMFSVTRKTTRRCNCGEFICVDCFDEHKQDQLIRTRRK